uniref:Uncharacterized protein n=1 Tax=Arundo donax TaxID=35708 RepID=A0A0A9EYG9_ARUDO
MTTRRNSAFHKCCAEGSTATRVPTRKKIPNTENRQCALLIYK